MSSWITREGIWKVERVWQEEGGERWVWFSIEVSGEHLNGDVQGTMGSLELEFRMEGGAGAVGVGFGSYLHRNGS